MGVQKKSMKALSTVMAFMMAVMVCAITTIPSQAARNNTAAQLATYAPVFNATYYANKYADLKAAFGTNEQALFNHFLTCGMKEGRQASEEFNVQAYKNRYADLRAAFGEDLKSYYLHYINNGKAEGRNARPDATTTNTTANTTANTTTTNTTTSNTNTTTASDSVAAYREEVIRLVNADRAANGLGPVTSTPELMNAAQGRAGEIVTSFSHTRPNGTSCFTMMDQCGVGYGWAGENIAAGQTSPAAVENAWMNSTGHRANILNGHFNHIGVGLVTTDGGYRYYWVQMFTD